MIRLFFLTGLTLAGLLGTVACNKSEAATDSAAAPPSATATAATPAPAKTAAAEVKTSGLSPSAIKKDFSALMGKQISGEAVMYHFESVTLNGEKQHNAYIADDEQKTASIQCMLAEATKIKAKTKVTFKGTLKTASWIDGCEIAEKN